jgi:ADP-heptose:LPS heptosyltransferase
MPFRQALLITKYVNCVIGCESGLMIGASMWYTPTIMLMTAASIESHCKYNPNDYSIQSPAYCSPCYKGPYQYRGCPHKNGNPLCVYFNVVDIINKIKQIYERRLVTV